MPDRFIRKNIPQDNNCFYLAIGITRNEAAELLSSAFQQHDIPSSLIDTVETELCETNFYNYLSKKKLVCVPSEEVKREANGLANNRIYIEAYLEFIKDTDQNVNYPCLLKVFSEILNIEFYCWSKTESGLEPVDIEHFHYKPADVKRRIDLLIDGHYIDKIEFADGVLPTKAKAIEIIDETPPSKPADSSSDNKNNFFYKKKLAASVPPDELPVPQSLAEYKAMLASEMIETGEGVSLYENNFWTRIQLLPLSQEDALLKSISLSFNQISNTVSFIQEEKKVLFRQKLQPHEVAVFCKLMKRDLNGQGVILCQLNHFLEKFYEAFPDLPSKKLVAGEEGVESHMFFDQKFFVYRCANKILMLLKWPENTISAGVGGTSKRLQAVDCTFGSSLLLTRTDYGHTALTLAIRNQRRRSLNASQIRALSSILFGASTRVWQVGPHEWITPAALLLSRSQNMNDARMAVKGMRSLHQIQCIHGDLKPDNISLTEHCLIDESRYDASQLWGNYTAISMKNVPSVNDFKNNKVDIIFHQDAKKNISVLYAITDNEVKKLSSDGNEELQKNLPFVETDVQLRNIIEIHKKFLIVKGLPLKGEYTAQLLDMWDGVNGQHDQPSTPAFISTQLMREIALARLSNNTEKLNALSYVRDMYAMALTLLEVYGHYDLHKKICTSSKGIPIGLPIFTVEEYHNKSRDSLELSLIENYRVPLSLENFKVTYLENDELRNYESGNDGVLKSDLKDRIAVHGHDDALTLYSLDENENIITQDLNLDSEQCKYISKQMELNAGSKDEATLIAELLQFIRDMIISKEIIFEKAFFNNKLKQYDEGVKKTHDFVESYVHLKDREVFLLLISDPVKYYETYCCNAHTVDAETIYEPKALRDTPDLETMIKWSARSPEPTIFIPTPARRSLAAIKTEIDNEKSQRDSEPPNPHRMI